MLFSSNDVCRCRVRANDGELGSVCDLFFDERTWTIQHVVVNTGGWPPGNRLLVPREHFGCPDWSQAELEIAAARRDLDEDTLVRVPMPRTYQAKLRCRPSFVWAFGPGGLARRMIEARPEHLRSAREINGYRVDARDGRCGQVEGLLFESDDWALRYLVVGLGWTFAARALVPLSATTGIDEREETVLVDLARPQLESGPRLETSDLRLPSGTQLLVVREGAASAGSHGISAAVAEA
jgi:hypothetical protein